VRQHAGRLHKAQSLTLEVEGELAARQGGGAATGCDAWIPRTAAGAAFTQEQANRLYMSHQSEVAAPLLQISTPVAICWEPLAVVPRRDNIVGGLVLAVPLAICSEQQDVILRRRAITGGAALTTIRTEPPVIVLLHVGRFVRSWSWLWMAVGKFACFPWDPGETSITPPPQIKAFGLFIVLVVNKILSRDVKG